MVLCDGLHVGYLSAGMAAEYAPVISRLEHEGQVVTPGEFEAWDDGIGIRLHLPVASALAAWAAAPPRDRPWVGLVEQRVNLKRSGDFAEQLNALLGRQDQTEVSARVSSYPVERGKYKGELGLEFAVNGTIIGVLQPQYRDQAPELFERAAAGPMTVPVMINRWKEGGVRARAVFFVPAGSPPPREQHRPPPSMPPPPPGASPSPTVPPPPGR